jgi:hypothetical protein
MCGSRKDRNIILRDIKQSDISVFEIKQFYCIHVFLFVCQPFLVRNITVIMLLVEKQYIKSMHFNISLNN